MDASTLRSRLRKVKLLLLDVDGVLTDGRIIYDSAGQELKFFDVHDGMGVFLLKKAGIPTMLVTAKGSCAIAPRARDMQVECVFADLSPKTKVLAEIQASHRLGQDQICFVGDDLVDLGLMKRVGVAVAVRQARKEIRKAAAYVTRAQGGRGAVREVAEMILEAQGKWKSLVRAYEA